MKKYIKKILLIGNHGVGKSSLVTRYIDNKFSDTYLNTIGVNIMKKMMRLQHDGESVEVVLMLWDVEGSADIQAIPAHYAKGCSGFIVVIDNTRNETVESLQSHIAYINTYDSSVPFVVAINKSDLKSQINVEKVKCIQQYDNCRAIIETSAKENNNVEKLFLTITDATI